MIRFHHLTASALSVAGALLVAALAGCSTKVVAPAPAEAPPPPASATGAVQRFAWGLNHKDLDVVTGLLSGDFVFVSAGADSAGNAVTNDRGWFLVALAALADSSSTVSFVTDQNLVRFPDSRPGRNPTWHKQVRTSVNIAIRGSSLGDFDLTGNALFFVTRGDSAVIPAELRARGVMPDSTRWWIDRYEDETLAGSSLVHATDPSRRWTFGSLLAYFLGLTVH